MFNYQYLLFLGYDRGVYIHGSDWVNCDRQECDFKKTHDRGG